MRKAYVVAYGTFRSGSFPAAFSLSSFLCLAHSEQEAKGLALEKCEGEFPRNIYDGNYAICVNVCDMDVLSNWCEEYQKAKSSLWVILSL